jgi:hypothetical protein
MKKFRTYEKVFTIMGNFFHNIFNLSGIYKYLPAFVKNVTEPVKQMLLNIKKRQFKILSPK